MTKEALIDRIEIYTTLSRTPNEVCPELVTVNPLPEGARMFHLFPLAKPVIIDMTMDRIDPSNEQPHIVLHGLTDKDEVILLEDGIGRKKIDQNTIVVFDASRLTKALAASRWKASGW